MARYAPVVFFFFFFFVKITLYTVDGRGTLGYGDWQCSNTRISLIFYVNTSKHRTFSKRFYLVVVWFWFFETSWNVFKCYWATVDLRTPWNCLLNVEKNNKKTLFYVHFKCLQYQINNGNSTFIKPQTTKSW